jgi:hypothetical protein
MESVRAQRAIKLGLGGKHGRGNENEECRPRGEQCAEDEAGEDQRRNDRDG